MVFKNSRHEKLTKHISRWRVSHKVNALRRVLCFCFRRCLPAPRCLGSPTQGNSATKAEEAVLKKMGRSRLMDRPKEYTVKVRPCE